IGGLEGGGRSTDDMGRDLRVQAAGVILDRRSQLSDPRRRSRVTPTGRRIPSHPIAPRAARQFERSMMRTTAMKPTLVTSVLVAMLNLAPALAQAPVPPVPAPRPPVASNATDYKMVVGDKLRVEVYRDPQMSQSLQIRPDGKITLPLVGDVVAAGKTPAALRDSLTTSLKEFITNPVVTVIVVE